MGASAQRCAWGIAPICRTLATFENALDTIGLNPSAPGMVQRATAECDATFRVVRAAATNIGWAPRGGLTDLVSTL